MCWARNTKYHYSKWAWDHHWALTIFPFRPSSTSCVRKYQLRLCLVHVKYFPENKYFSRNAIFEKRKCIQAVWLSRNSFYRKSIPIFGSFKHFTENAFRFTENQFPYLVRSNILRKIEFIFYGKSIPMFDLWIILWKIWNALQIQAPALPRQTCNSTKLIIHFNIKNNHPNSSTYIA